MTRQKRETRPSMDIPAGQLEYLLTGDLGGDTDAFLWSRDPGAVRRAWKAGRGEVLRDWIEERPGTRPWAFWKFDLSEPRRLRVGGTGDLVPAYDCGANVDFGIFRKHSFVDGGLLNAWRKIGCLKRGEKFTTYDPEDPPRYEAQASFLRRHNLLTAAERKALPPDAFDPEAVR